MESNQIAALLLSLAILIGLARLLGELARRFRQPAILGELLAGVLLGPTLFGTLAPGYQSYLFPSDGPGGLVLDGIALLSIVLFLLVAGMEVDLSIVWKQGRAALKVGTLATIVPFSIGLAAAVTIPGSLGRQVDADPVIFALFLATAVAISALPVIAKTLMDLDLYRTDLGMVIISAAVLNDLVGWTIFAIILGLLDSQGTAYGVAMTLILTVVFAITTLTLGRWLMHRALPVLHAYTHYPGGVLGFAVTVGLLGAATTEFIGIHAIFGAFVVGIALGDSPHLSEQTRVMIDNFVSFIFAPIFFASIGLKVNYVTHFDPVIVLLVLGLTIAGKLVGATWGAAWGGFARSERWAIGFGISATGAMGIILGTMALEAGIIRQRLFVALVTTAIVTSAFSGPLIRRTLRRRQPHRIASFLSQRMFVRHLSGLDRRDAIRELSGVVAQYGDLDQTVVDARVWEREELAATGIGHGVAIPHARLADLHQPLVAVGISEVGIDFDSPDGQPAHVIFLLVTPHSDSAAQLELTAEIALVFRDARCLERVLRAASFTEFLGVMRTAKLT